MAIQWMRIQFVNYCCRPMYMLTPHVNHHLLMNPLLIYYIQEINRWMHRFEICRDYER